MQLSRDFKDLLTLFSQHGVRFLVVGGYATSVHAVPRYTKDLDIWVDNTADNAKRIIVALEDFGFGGIGLEDSDFTSADMVVQLGYEPNRVDLLTSLKGVDFSDCYPRSLEVEIGDTAVPFIGRDDLIVNKKAVGRLRDLADVDEILRREGPSPS